MSQLLLEKLEKALKQCLGDEVPANVVHDIHAALELSEILERKGFVFQLKDLCPKSQYETQWRAVFSKDGKKFLADDSQSSVAVCMAAVDALTH